MSYAAIKTALEKRLQSVADIPVVFDDSRYRKKPKTAFLRATFQPEKVTPRLVGRDEPQEYQGRLDIVIFEVSHMAAIIRADALRAQFPRGVSISQDGINIYVVKAELTRDQQNLNHNAYRLRIRWRSYF